MKTKDWHNQRAKGIGGSDAGVIMKVNKYKTVHDLWLEKKHKIKPDDVSNRAVDLGVALEPILVDLFKETHKDKYIVKVSKERYKHPKNEFMHAEVDGILEEVGTSRKGGLEIKTTTIQNKVMLDDWKDQVPNTYYCQVLHYMETLQLDFYVLYVWIGFSWSERQELKIYHFERSEHQESIDLLVEEEKKFWDLVQNDVEPPKIDMKIEI
ncbi:MAG: lambda-exonuclease family protein [Oscillospiraceae bacterium]